MIHRLLPTLLVAVGLIALPASAMAKVNVAVGIGDQSARMFADPNWKSLKMKKTRYFIEWNAIGQPAELAKADDFVKAAKQAGVKVLMHISTDDINAEPRSPLPSVHGYRKKVKALIRRYRPRGVSDWGAWNEANHSSQPTQQNPRRASQFFEQMRSLCRGCTIVALDVLDLGGVQRYINRWFAALGRSNARKAMIIGIHNYSEVNRRLTKGSDKHPGTKRIIDTARAHNRSAKFWYTETGGHVKLFGTCSTARAADRTAFMFSLAKKFRRFIQRLYTYNWTAATPACDDATRFDAGIVNPDGSPRPAYNVIRSKLKAFRT